MKTKIIILSIILAGIVYSSCTDREIECHGSIFIVTSANDNLTGSTYEELDREIDTSKIYVSTTDTALVRFSIGRSIGNLCPYVPVQIKIQATAIDIDSSRNVHMLAEAKFQSGNTAGGSTSIIDLVQGAGEHSTNASSLVNPFKDFELEVTSMNVFVTIEFKSSGNIDTDKAWFISHFKRLFVEAKGTST